MPIFPAASSRCFLSGALLSRVLGFFFLMSRWRGLAPVIVEELAKTIAGIREHGISENYGRAEHQDLHGLG